MKKILTATEVSRNFSEVLKMVELGQEIEITRGKKTIALLSPKGESSGSKLAELLKTSGSVFDEELVGNIQKSKQQQADPDLNRIRV